MFRSCRFPYIKLSFVADFLGSLPPLWVSRGTVFVPRFPSKSKLIHKHIVKHIVALQHKHKHTVIHIFVSELSISFLVPWFPSKSGLIPKHIVKHIGSHTLKFSFADGSFCKHAVRQISRLLLRGGCSGRGRRSSPQVC